MLKEKVIERPQTEYETVTPGAETCKRPLTRSTEKQDLQTERETERLSVRRDVFHPFVVVFCVSVLIILCQSVVVLCGHFESVCCHSWVICLTNWTTWTQPPLCVTGSRTFSQADLSRWHMVSHLLNDPNKHRHPTGLCVEPSPLHTIHLWLYITHFSHSITPWLSLFVKHICKLILETVKPLTELVLSNDLVLNTSKKKVHWL